MKRFMQICSGQAGGIWGFFLLMDYTCSIIKVGNQVGLNRPESLQRYAGLVHVACCL